MKKKAFISLLTVLVFAVIAGCQHAGTGSKTYSPGQAQKAMEVYYGTVLNVSEVQIKHAESGVGAVAGGVAGGVAGSTIGGGGGKKLATVGGALAGAAVGGAAERAAATRPGVEIELELDDGRILVIAQEKDDEYAVGDRVRLLKSSDGTMRVRQ